LNLFYIK